MTTIFHLALPVIDLETSRTFYQVVLEATVGRSNDEWIDLFVWGHQLTLHLRPDEVLPREQQGVRHFGVILPWAEWEEAARRLEARGVAFMMSPVVKHRGTPKEQGKFFLEDPSGHVIEVKSYRELESVFEGAV